MYRQYKQELREELVVLSIPASFSRGPSFKSQTNHPDSCFVGLLSLSLDKFWDSNIKQTKAIPFHIRATPSIKLTFDSTTTAADDKASLNKQIAFPASSSCLVKSKQLLH
jgi:hypothetical protein